MRHDIIEYAEVSPVIGRTVTVTVDRPLGSYHPEHKDMSYPIMGMWKASWHRTEKSRMLTY